MYSPMTTIIDAHTARTIIIFKTAAAITLSRNSRRRTNDRSVKHRNNITLSQIYFYDFETLTPNRCKNSSRKKNYYNNNDDDSKNDGNNRGNVRTVVSVPAVYNFGLFNNKVIIQNKIFYTTTLGEKILNYHGGTFDRDGRRVVQMGF